MSSLLWSRFEVASVADHIKAADAIICANIATLQSRRDLLSQNVLGQLRNLVESAAVRLHVGHEDVEYNYGAIEAALSWVKANSRLNFITKFHTLLKPSVSHYTFDGDTSERLMLRYYEYMLRLCTLLHDEARLTILGNRELFPLDQDRSPTSGRAFADRMKTPNRAHGRGRPW